MRGLPAAYPIRKDDARAAVAADGRGRLGQRHQVRAAVVAMVQGGRWRRGLRPGLLAEPGDVEPLAAGVAGQLARTGVEDQVVAAVEAFVMQDHRRHPFRNCEGISGFRLPFIIVFLRQDVHRFPGSEAHAARDIRTMGTGGISQKKGKTDQIVDNQWVSAAYRSLENT
jgi:hypothetical protein